MQISKERLDELTKDFKTPEQMESLYSQMLQHMINRALEAELTAHLGHERHGESAGNVRNGKSRKTVKSNRRFTTALTATR
jgi:transposase-like protein